MAKATLLNLLRHWRQQHLFLTKSEVIETAWLENERWNRENDPEAYYAQACASDSAAAWDHIKERLYYLLCGLGALVLLFGIVWDFVHYNDPPKFLITLVCGGFLLVMAVASVVAVGGIFLIMVRSFWRALGPGERQPRNKAN